MSDVLSQLPLFDADYTSEVGVRDRMDADVNAGLDPTDEANWDTRQGTTFNVLSQPVVIEAARLWDGISVELISAAFPATAWGDYLDAHAETFGLERHDALPATGSVTFSGPNGTLIANNVIVATTQTDPDVPAIEFKTTSSGTISGGTYTATVEALETGTAGNVGIGTVTNILSGAEGITGVTNAAPMLSGTEVESDDELRERVLLGYAGGGAGNIADYKRWALNYPGVGRVTVIPQGLGAATVEVDIMDADGDPVSAGIVTGLQAYLDPGDGEGVAPIDHIVTVRTPAQVAIAIVASITFQAGFTLDGTGGTVALRSIILDALRTYLNNLQAGDDVVFDHVKAQFYTVTGVYKVTALTVQGGSADVSLATTQVAALGTTTLS